jgi:hypothetical protein
MKAMTAPENRRALRYPVDVSAELKVGKQIVPARTKNLSETGVCLVLGRPLDEGASFDLNLFLTVDGIEDPDSPPLDIGVSVIWASPGNDNDHLAGCHFAELDGTKVKILKDFLASLGE